MSDLRDELRKAGLISDKQLRQAKHQDRVHAKEVGFEARRKEREAEADRQRAEGQARRRADQERERARARELESAAHTAERAIRAGWIRDATLGQRRFFFETGEGRITYLDLSDSAALRLASGKAAIAKTHGMVPGEFCLVTDRAAAELREADPGWIVFWNEGRPARDGRAV